MAEFKEVVKQKERMCAFHLEKMLCEYCPIYDEVHVVSVDCNDYILAHPQETEKIIMDWASRNPIKTNADKFKEVFGKEPRVCVFETYDCDIEKCDNCEFGNFWDEEYKELGDEKNETLCL